MSLGPQIKSAHDIVLESTDEAAVLEAFMQMINLARDMRPFAIDEELCSAKIRVTEIVSVHLCQDPIMKNGASTEDGAEQPKVVDGAMMMNRRTRRLELNKWFHENIPIMKAIKHLARSMTDEFAAQAQSIKDVIQTSKNADCVDGLDMCLKSDQFKKDAANPWATGDDGFKQAVIKLQLTVNGCNTLVGDAADAVLLNLRNWLEEAKSTIEKQVPLTMVGGENTGFADLDELASAASMVSKILVANAAPDDKDWVGIFNCLKTHGISAARNIRQYRESADSLEACVAKDADQQKLDGLLRMKLKGAKEDGLAAMQLDASVTTKLDELFTGVAPFYLKLTFAKWNNSIETLTKFAGGLKAGNGELWKQG